MSARSASGPMPWRSAAPARKPCITTSTRGTERVDDRKALRVGDVDAEALLALHHLDARTFGERHHVADRVALERLDVDDAGAEVGEQRRAERCGEQPRELEHRHPVERQLAVRHGFGVHKGRAAAGFGRQNGLRRRGWRSRLGVGVAVGVDEQAGLADRAVVGVEDLEHVAVVHELRMVEDLGPRAEQLRVDVGVGREDRLPLGEGLRVRPLLHRRPQLASLVGVVEQGDALPLGVVEKMGEVEGAHQCEEQPRRDLRELHPPAVGGHRDHEQEGEHAGGRAVGVVELVGEERIRPPLLHEVDEPVPRVERREPLHEVALDVLAHAAALALDQRREHTVQRGVRRGERRVGGGDERRPRATCDLPEARERAELRLHDSLVALHAGERALPSEAGHRRVHEARVHAGEVVVPEPEPVRHAGPEGLDEDVGGGRERRARLERPASLRKSSATLRLPRAQNGNAGSRRSGAPARRLDPHDVRAVIGEELAHLRADARRRQVDDRQAAEQTGALRVGHRQISRSMRVRGARAGTAPRTRRR